MRWLQILLPKSFLHSLLISMEFYPFQKCAVKWYILLDESNWTNWNSQKISTALSYINGWLSRKYSFNVAYSAEWFIKIMAIRLRKNLRKYKENAANRGLSLDKEQSVAWFPSCSSCSLENCMLVSIFLFPQLPAGNTKSSVPTFFTFPPATLRHREQHTNYAYAAWAVEGDKTEREWKMDSRMRCTIAFLVARCHWCFFPLCCAFVLAMLPNMLAKKKGGRASSS